MHVDTHPNITINELFNKIAAKSNSREQYLSNMQKIIQKIDTENQKKMPNQHMQQQLQMQTPRMMVQPIPASITIKQQELQRPPPYQQVGLGFIYLLTVPTLGWLVGWKEGRKVAFQLFFI